MQKALTHRQQLLLRTSAANQASKLIADRIIAQATSQAVRDAEAGDQDAVEWLDVCAPDWREDHSMYELHDLIGMHAIGVEF